ncbi:metallophosphoesterase [Ruminococcus sp. FC2018]|uniref:metallophosphoesterase family protein n=1 Tax=Ruminococcus sp. FC2018 TaxID=1410617 RepID=UPI00048DC9DE|nr:metallophosphoesterase [Ruminococcus sp. FC2018]
MKIIHCADIHLGSKLASKFPKNISAERKREVLDTFSRMVDYAKKNDVKVIMLSGDVFDKDKPAKKDKTFFYSAIKNNPDIDFLYLNGNHDKEGSYTDNNIPNLKTFGKDDFTSYAYGDIVITGIEMNEDNARAYYSKLMLDGTKTNILMLHGDVSDSVGMDKVKISELRDKGIDYLALGHIHSYKTGKIDDRGVWAFSGCLEGRGFDECGKKGFVLVDAADKLSFSFVPFAKRTIQEINVDISSAADLYETQQLVRNEVDTISRDDILNIILKGDVPIDAIIDEKDIENSLSDFYFAHVKNKTSVKINASDYVNDRSLIGEFIRSVLANGDYNDSEKKDIITVGLRLLSGKGVDR